VPTAIRAAVEPFIPTIVDAIHQAFSIATASTFVIGIVSSLAAACLVLLFRDAPAAAGAGAQDGDADASRTDESERGQAAA
jgi:hypothetical protein